MDLALVAVGLARLAHAVRLVDAEPLLTFEPTLAILQPQSPLQVVALRAARVLDIPRFVSLAHRVRPKAQSVR